MSEQTGVSGDLDSLECLNKLECLEKWTVRGVLTVFRVQSEYLNILTDWSVWKFVQSGMFEQCEVSGDLDSLEYLNRQYLE